MATFININDPSKPALITDAEKIAVISDNRQKNSMSFCAVDEGDFMYLPRSKNREFPTRELLQKIADAGVELFPLPFNWADDEKIGYYYINPAYVQSIMVSEETVIEGQGEPVVSILADVKGYKNRIETYDVPVSIAEAFVQAVETKNPHMLRIGGDQASCRWFRSDYTILDTREIRSISPAAVGVDIILNDGSRLDFSLPYDEFEVPQDIFDAFHNDNDEKKLHKDVYLAREQHNKTLRTDFSNAVAAQAPDLTPIQNAKETYYTHLGQIFSIHTFSREGEICVQYKKAEFDGRHDNEMDVVFASKEEAEQEMERLTGLLNGLSPEP